MKVGQKAIVRWMSKLVAQGNRSADSKQVRAALVEVDAQQMRLVSGGGGESSQLPKHGW
jgi:hypothetical protein